MRCFVTIIIICFYDFKFLCAWILFIFLIFTIFSPTKISFFDTAYIFYPSEYTAHSSPCLLLRHAVATSAPANEGALHHDGCSVHSVLLHPHLQPAQEGDLHRQTRQQGSSEDHAGWHRR